MVGIAERRVDWASSAASHPTVRRYRTYWSAGDVPFVLFDRQDVRSGSATASSRGNMTQSTLTYGTAVHLRSCEDGGGRLAAEGSVSANRDFAGYDEVEFVVTRPVDMPDAPSAQWVLVSADGKDFGDDVLVGDWVHLRNLSSTRGYLDSCGWIKWTAPFSSLKGAVDCGVFTHRDERRDGGSTGKWRIGGPGMAVGQPLGAGASISLENGYSGAGHLVAYGKTSTTAGFQALSKFHRFAFTSTESELTSGRGAWTITPVPVPGALVPLQTPTTLKNDFVATLTGTAIKGAPYEIHYDTGSWSLNVPDEAVGVVTELDANAVGVLGRPARRVKGTIGLASVDGTTTYSVDDFEFFALKAPNDKADRTAAYNAGLMGAFPASTSGATANPLPLALVAKYAKDTTGKVTGFGYAMHGGRSYLFFGPDPAYVDDAMVWRTNIPTAYPSLPFFPESIPGFSVELTFSGGETVSVPGLAGTIDSGAPEMVLRLGSSDPQNSPALAKYFTTDGYWRNWRNADYAAAAKQVSDRCRVKVTFTDSSGNDTSYTFTAGSGSRAVAVGTWAGNVPWSETPARPKTRFTLGNTIFRYTSAIYYDLAQSRIGFRFR